MKWNYFAGLMLGAFVLAACESKPQEADLVFLSTSDTHGMLLDYDFKKEAPAKASLANVSTYLKEVRQDNPDNVLVFENGDILQGQPSVYLYNFKDTAGMHVCSQAYNYLQYDALNLGNHDVEPGEDVYHHRLQKQFNMPWLCANAIDTRTGKPMFQPYAVFKRQGIKIAVLGLITPRIPAWLPKSLWPHLEFKDMVESANEWVPIIQKKENPDLLIGLFHSGADYTVNDCDFDTPYNENATVPTATKVPGFDFIIYGHDHRPNQFVKENCEGKDIAFINPGRGAERVARIDVHMTLQEDGSYKKEINTKLIDMKKVPADTAYNAHFQPIVDRVNEYTNTVIGHIPTELRSEEGLVGPSPMMDMIHEAQLWAAHAEISMAAVLDPKEYIPAGEIRMRQLFNIYKYENRLYTVKMTAEEIRTYLEFGFALQFNTMKSAKDHLLLFKPEEPGKPLEVANITYNYTCAAGIRYTVDVTKEPGSRVTLLSMSDGTAIDPKRMYKVAINSYQYSGGGNFITKGLGWDRGELESRTVEVTNGDIRRYVAEYLVIHDPYTPHLRGDYNIIPENWWKEAKKRDLEILNSNTPIE